MALHLGWKPELSWMYTPALALAMVLSLSGAASAHRPLFAGAGATYPDSAVQIADPSVSHVIYSELTAESPVRWFVFENTRARDVAIQVGVPSEPRRQVADPVVALFGPGLPDRPDRLPFAPPQGEEAGTIAIRATENPSSFHEPITGTSSRIVAGTHVHLPSAGTYYGAVYDDAGQEGKVWLSIGQREGFSWRDVSRLPGWIRDVRRFHEVSGWPNWAWMGTAGVLTAVSLLLGWVIRRRR